MNGTEPLAAAYTWPTADPACVPFAVYTDPAIFAAEQERIFCGPVWHYLGLEAEIPKPGDFVSTYVGTLPVVLNRTEDGRVAAFVNRCAHRGAIVTRPTRGNCATHVCIYHQWTYDHDGNLAGVPYRHGLGGVGGFPADFDPRAHGLRKLRVAVHCGIVFGTLAEAGPSLAEFLGKPVLDRLARLFSRPVAVLGYQRQHVRGNWKLMVENVKDAYHGGLLHAFNSKFGFFRSTQKGEVTVAGGGVHSILTTFGTTGEQDTGSALQNVQTYRPALTLEGLLAAPHRGVRRRHRDEHRLGVSILPSASRQQFSGVPPRPPKATGEFEMVWTYIGYADDSEEMRDLRLRQANLVGPAGYISIEDAEAVELVQRAIEGERSDALEIVALGGRGTDSQGHLVTEAAIRGFWQGYRKLMGFPVAA